MDVVVEQLHRPRPLVTLDDEAARQPEVAGAKAASLARSRQQGLPVLDGFVIITSGALLLAAEYLRRQGRDPRAWLGEVWGTMTAVPLTRVE